MMENNDVYVCGANEHIVKFYKVERFTARVVWLIPIGYKVVRAIKGQKELIPVKENHLGASKKYLLQPGGHIKTAEYTAVGPAYPWDGKPVKWREAVQ
jgi:hypothetical protein